MLDRSVQPEFGKIEAIDLPEPKVQHLDNGTPVFSIDAGTQEVLKVDLVFEAGTTASDKILVASSANKLMRFGTKNRTASEIAESVDFFGAHLENSIDHTESSLSLFSLTKHLKSTLATLSDVYFNASFPEHEMKTFLLKSQQELLVSQEKVSYLCSKGFKASLFGGGHPYGKSANTDDYDKILRQDLLEFHESRIKDRLKYIIIAGKLDSDTLDQIAVHFGSNTRVETRVSNIPSIEVHSEKVHIDKPDVVQNAIQIGRVLFNRNHPDFIGMQILATVLGGYFGSRLMKNIREDKGYTYGIGAGLVSLKESGYLSVSTEVGADVCLAALNEIYLEIGKLRKELIPNSELELVKNYMLGSILKTVDGPFQIASKWKNYLKYGLGADAHNNLIYRIKTITPELLRELAQKYLQQKDLKQVTAGKPF